MKAPIVLAVDTQDLDTAQRWIEATQDHVSVYKLGLEFFLTFGREGVRRIKGVTDSDIFLDLKLHDIPHTVGAAATAVQSLKPRFLTVHASGGRAMISAAVQALPTTDVTAVTILTSLSEEDLFEIGFANKALESAVALAKMSTEAGARAIVCSPLEIAAIRSAVGDEPQIITPGVRPEGSSGGDDQKRTMTPRAAIAAGASYVVIGRPITQAWAQGANAMTTAARTIAEDILQ
ncbi:orotidine-5'-phosphate decarboxylase [Candidatus Planktophila versatilis]|uniref:orotidine-5'-phosphate decarboxylase n=1 Tax=Candidatus Planktophila versatilis TaxID=1884905 RepID=UPI000BACE46B|nr:orotidine-5'-phosphate decarboxylase [Candidatus Planktophila versatilis]ASY18587.1 orotidine-5'-phosphate decarboxylase [Candidatus Planktophila versatilis]